MTLINRALVFAALTVFSIEIHAAALEVFYLANEGYLLKSADEAVIIDGLITKPAWNYAVLPESVFSLMLEAEPPFEHINLLLASHMHADHFQARPAVEFLVAHPESVFHSSEQVTDLLRSAVAANQLLLKRIGKTELPAGMTLGFDLQGVRVEFFPLSHGTGRFADIQNFGQLITVGDKRVLHIGDAAMVLSNFRVYHLPQKDIDIAIIPYWYFGYQEGIAIYKNLIGAKHYIAAHIPPDKVSQVAAQLAENFPEVKILHESLEKLVID